MQVQIVPFLYSRGGKGIFKKVMFCTKLGNIVLFTLSSTFFRCKLKSDLVSNIIRRCLRVDDLTKLSLKYGRGWSISLIGLFNGNLIFHWKAQSLIFIKSLFRSFAVEFIFWTTENREVSSTNNFVFEVKPSDKSLI